MTPSFPWSCSLILVSRSIVLIAAINFAKGVLAISSTISGSSAFDLDGAAGAFAFLLAAPEAAVVAGRLGGILILVGEEKKERRLVWREDSGAGLVRRGTTRRRRRIVGCYSDWDRCARWWEEGEQRGGSRSSSRGSKAIERTTRSQILKREAMSIVCIFIEQVYKK